MKFKTPNDLLSHLSNIDKLTINSIEDIVRNLRITNNTVWQNIPGSNSNRKAKSLLREIRNRKWEILNN